MIKEFTTIIILIFTIACGKGNDSQTKSYKEQRLSAEGRDLLDQGHKLRTDGKFDESLQAFTMAGGLFLEANNQEGQANAEFGIGWILKEKGNPQKALEHYQTAKELLKKTTGDKSEQYANLLNSQGAAKEALEKNNEAFEDYKTALGLFEAIDKDHPAIGTCYNNLAMISRKQGKLEQTLDYYNKSLTLASKTYGQDHPQVAIRLNNLARAYKDLKKPDKAIDNYNKALNIFIKAFGPDHPNVATVNNNLGQIHKKQGSKPKACDYLKEALRIYQTALNHDHPNIIEAQKEMEYCQGL